MLRPGAAKLPCQDRAISGPPRGQSTGFTHQFLIVEAMPVDESSIQARTDTFVRVLQ